MKIGGQWLKSQIHHVGGSWWIHLTMDWDLKGLEPTNKGELEMEMDLTETVTQLWILSIPEIVLRWSESTWL